MQEAHEKTKPGPERHMRKYYISFDRSEKCCLMLNWLKQLTDEVSRGLDLVQRCVPLSEAQNVFFGCQQELPF